MNLKHLSRLSLTLAASTGTLALVAFIYITFDESSAPTVTEDVPRAAVAPVMEESEQVVQAEAPALQEVIQDAPGQPQKRQEDLNIESAISAFATAIADDNSALSTKELVHLDELFENLAHQAEQEKTN